MSKTIPELAPKAIPAGTDEVEISTGSVSNRSPVSAFYARAQHTGTQLASTISDFNTAVRTNRLDQMAVPTALVNLNGQDLDNIQKLIHDISVTTTVLNFVNDELQTISINANTTFTTSGRAIGRSKTVKISNGGTLRTLTFPAGWTFVGAKPADIAPNKDAILTLTNYGSTDALIIAAYAVEA